jgi:hypothetical protein
MNHSWSRLAAVCISAVLIAFLLWLCGRGFELTDEGFYLNSIAYPWAQAHTHLLFGFAFHPLYLLAGGDVAILRYANVVMLWLCASLAFFAVLNELSAKPPLLQKLALSAALGVTSFNLFLLWLPTPSYNSLALSGLLLATAGAVTCHRDRLFSVGPIALGVGGYLTFLGKISSAAILAPVALVYLHRTRTLWSVVAIAGGVSAFLLLTTATVIDDSILGFVDRLCGGLTLLHTLSHDHDLLQLLKLQWPPMDILSGGLLVGMTALVLGTARNSARKFSSTTAFLFAMPFVYAFGTANNPWYAVSMAAVFFVAAAVSGSGSIERVTAVAISSVLVTAVLMCAVVVKPYRQSSLFSQASPTHLGVLTSREVANYVNTLERGARNAGFAKGAPVLDLTGEFPGTVYAIGGSSPGSGWLVYGYPNSERYIDAALNTVKCSEISQAWILVKSSAPDGVYPSMLARRGLSVADYDAVASAEIQNHRWGDTSPAVHTIMRPKTRSDEKLTNCKQG